MINTTLKRRLSIKLAIVFTSILLIGCTGMDTPVPKSEKLNLPAISKTATNKHYTGKFVWHDLLTADISSSKVFYAEVFAWSFEDEGGYALIYNHGKRIGGMMEQAPKEGSKAEAVWLPSMSVANVDSTVAYVKMKKGKVLKGPLDMKERGRGALVSDPWGAHIVLLHTKKGDPLDSTPQIGDWLWNELWTNQPKESYAFYRKLGKYDASKPKDEYHILKTKGKWRAGIRDISNDTPKSRWVPTIRVSDLEETMRKAKASGGEVLVSPQKELVHGDVALISDDKGALVIIQRWNKGGQK